MADVHDDFEAVRQERDPLEQGRGATRLLALYQERSKELARLRRAAIDRAREEQGLSYSEVAAELGLSKGRIGQIRLSAPPAERGLFGVGPITVAVPQRTSAKRELPVIAAEDALAADQMTELLESLAFPVTRFRIPPDGQWEPTGDTVAICGPKSSPVIDQLLRSDPHLSLRPDRSRRWHLTNRDTSEKFYSPMDESPPADADIAYLGKHQLDGATLVVIAGVHAIGSVGAVHYLARHLGELHAAVGDGPFSMATTATFHGETIKRSDELCPPRTHR